MKAAGFPSGKSLEDFDWDAQPAAGRLRLGGLAIRYAERTAGSSPRSLAVFRTV